MSSNEYYSFHQRRWRPFCETHVLHMYHTYSIHTLGKPTLLLLASYQLESSLFLSVVTDLQETWLLYTHAYVGVCMCVVCYPHLCAFYGKFDASVVMYACMFTCMHVCLHVCMYVYMYVCMFTCFRVEMYPIQNEAGFNLNIHAYVYTCICIYMHMYVHAYIYTCICIYMHMYVHAYVYTCICIYMHMYIHAYVYACTHTRINPNHNGNRLKHSGGIYICEKKL
jgi:hypothetical protein